jgi:hypothetical protein
MRILWSGDRDCPSWPEWTRVLGRSRAGAPPLVPLLLAASLIVVSHPPPIGPIGLACFAGAVVLLARSGRASAPAASRHLSLTAP